MEFNIKTWRTYYDKVHQLGTIIKKNVHEKFNTGRCDLSDDGLQSLLAEADSICRDSELYLSRCGLQSRTPKWRYNIKDTTTHASHEDFAYRHLM